VFMQGFVVAFQFIGRKSLQRTAILCHPGQEIISIGRTICGGFHLVVCIIGVCTVVCIIGVLQIRADGRQVESKMCVVRTVLQPL